MKTAENILPSQTQMLVESLEQLIKCNGIEVPMLPEVANKALLLAQNPDSDACEMAQLIQSDQSLAGHVMRVANSVAYTPLSNLVSLQQAIARLGMGLISEIALSVSIGAKFFNTPGYDDYVASIWQHALASSLWSKEIARHCRSNVEVAFLGGLLHSIGRPAVLQTVLDLAKKYHTELSEEEVCGLESSYSHQVSQAVVNTWKMPVLVIEAVTEFNNPATTLNHAALVNAGAEFATVMLASESNAVDQLVTLPAIGNLNLYHDEIEKILDQTENIKNRVAGLSA